jgi:hypothetical protein
MVTTPVCCVHRPVRSTEQASLAPSTAFGRPLLGSARQAHHTVVTVSERLTDSQPSAADRELARLRAENARLLRLLNLTRQEAAPPGPWQSGLFEAPPGLVHAGSPPEVKVALFGALFAARTDVYAVRWENARTAKAGWLQRCGAGGGRESLTPNGSICH